MKVKYIKYIIAFSIVLICIFQNKVFASVNEYAITKYDIDMIVNEDNIFEITENITANFYVPKHGIYRKIPLRNEVTRTDGTKSKNRAKITDIAVSENYDYYIEDGYKILKIGNANKTLTGEHSYTIKYKYDIGKDPLKNADEFYFNLIGNGWDTTISHVNFKITMPKAFDESSLGFSSGTKGSTNTYNVLSNVDGKTISGYFLGTLNEGEALTVRLTLPEGYFKGNNFTVEPFSIFVIVLSLFGVLIAYRLWNKYGKDDIVIDTVEFYPPEGYNSAEIGYLYKGKIDNQSIISLLIYLADKGYLKIEETEEKAVFNKNSKGFKITKLKDYDGENETEKKFFEGLFKGNSIFSYVKYKQIKEEAKLDGRKINSAEARKLATERNEMKDCVTQDDLYDNFYVTVSEISLKMNSKENKNKIFEKNTRRKNSMACII